VSAGKARRPVALSATAWKRLHVEEKVLPAVYSKKLVKRSPAVTMLVVAVSKSFMNDP